MIVIIWAVKFKAKVDPAIWSEEMNSFSVENAHFSIEDI